MPDKKDIYSKLIESEEKYRRIFENFHDLYYRATLDGIILDISPSVKRIAGYEPAELKGTQVFNVYKNPKDRLVFVKELKSKGQVNDFELLLLKKDGTEIHASASSHINFNEKGEPVDIEGVLRDIDERKIAEKELKESEERLKALSDATNEALFFSDKGICIDCNEAASRMFGYSYDELIGIFGTDVIAEESQELVKQNMISGYSEPYEAIGQRKDGSKFWAEFHGKMFGYKGKEVRVTAVRDISGRKKVEEELILAKEKAEKSDKLKTAFMNNISHEIRTPLNGVLGFAEFIADPNIDQEEKKEYLAILNESSQRLINTVTNYMDISLLVSGNMDITCSKFVPYKIITDLSTKYQKHCETKGIKLLIDVEEANKDLSIFTDDILVMKALHHILDNSYKFTSEGEIRIGFTLETLKIRFFVKDTGIGIKSDQLENIFQEFTQEDETTSRQHEGSGLGLAIVREIAQHLGGTTRAESELKKGTSIFVEIPVYFTDK